MDAQSWDQLSTTYFDQISSPFEQEVVNPLLSFLDGLPDRDKLTVGDLGCGIGNLLPFLSERFHRVVAVDFSNGMLRRARLRCAPTSAFPRSTISSPMRKRAARA